MSRTLFLARMLFRPPSVSQNAGKSKSVQTADHLPDAQHEDVNSLIGVHFVFRWEGAVWFVRFGNETNRVRDLVGMRYIAVLLKNVRTHFSAISLAQAAGRLKGPVRLHHVDLEAEGLAKQDGFSQQAKADQRAIDEVRRRRDELAGKQDGSPSEQLSRKEDIDAMDAFLREARGAFGRERTFRRHSRGLPNVDAVGKAISDSLNEMKRRDLLGLADHLKRSINPYTSPLAYRPEDASIRWLVSEPGVPTSRVGNPPGK